MDYLFSNSTLQIAGPNQHVNCQTCLLIDQGHGNHAKILAQFSNELLWCSYLLGVEALLSGRKR